MLSRYNSVCPRGDAAEGKGWIQHPLTCGGSSVDVWGETQAPLNHGCLPGTSPAAPHT